MSARPFTNRHMLAAIPHKAWDDQEYNPCSAGHSSEVYVSESWVEGLSYKACRRCGKSLEGRKR